MTDYKNIRSKLHSLLFLFDQDEIMPAVITILGEGSAASIASIVFYHILKSYIHFLYHQMRLVYKYDGYMVKTVSDIHIDTLLSVKQVRNALDKLKEYGLIDTKTRGTYNHTTIKVNVECVDLIEKAYEKFKMERDKKIEDKKDRISRQLDARKERYNLFLKNLSINKEDIDFKNSIMQEEYYEEN